MEAEKLSAVAEPEVALDTEVSSGRDALLAIRNAFKLGASLLFTWGIALALRFPIRRFLPPEQFGPINFAEAFAATAFVFLGLGVDTYIRQQIPVRKDHASDFFASIIGIRLALSGLIFLGMAGVMHFTHQPPAVRSLVYVFGAAQILFTMNQSLAALLHSQGTVDGLSVLNVVSKVIWGGGILLTLLLKLDLVGFAVSLMVAEAVKASVNFHLVRKHLGVRLNFQLGAARAVIVASLPFYLNTVSHTIYNKLDISVLGVVGNFTEVGWYTAASDLAGLTMLIAPMIGWVLMPLFARAAARSADEYTQVMRRSLELILIVAIPTSLAMALGADLWIFLGFGPKYAPAALALRILAPIFLLTYVAMVSSIALILNQRPWSVTLISIGGLIVNPLLLMLLIRPSMSYFGEAGGGAGCALAQVATEALVTTAMMVLIGRRAFDRRTLLMLAKTAVVCALVIGFDHFLGSLKTIFSPDPPRLVLDALLYCTLVVLVRAVRIQETVAFARSAFRKPAAG